MAKRKVSFKVWLERLMRFGIADRIDDWFYFGLPFTRNRIMVIIAWERNYGAPTKTKKTGENPTITPIKK